MDESRIERGGFMNIEQAQDINVVATMGFARGKVGQRYPLTDDEAIAEHAEQLGNHIEQLTITNTADCGDERPTIALADGTNDPDVLLDRITPQLFGGIGLAATKALVAANATAIKDAKNMWQAYETTSKLLEELGEIDAGHEGCGASASVESSVANAIPREFLVPSIGLFVPDSEASSVLIDKNSKSKQELLSDGFYSDWDPAKHADYLQQRFPQNFSFLKVDPNDHETQGHYGSSLLLVTGQGQGFAKNRFVRNTGGHMAFANTIPKMFELAHKLGYGDEERARIALAFADDALHVGGGIVVEGFPVLKQDA